jgi:hypothetical protein
MTRRKIASSFTVGLLAVSACSPARPLVGADASCAPSVRFINGQLDFGYEYALTVTNAGDQGDVSVRLTLSTSEGRFKRDQRLTFAQGESKRLSYFFQEPTVNVDSKNVQCDEMVSASLF